MKVQLSRQGQSLITLYKAKMDFVNEIFQKLHITLKMETKKGQAQRPALTFIGLWVRMITAQQQDALRSEGIYKHLNSEAIQDTRRCDIAAGR